MKLRQPRTVQIRPKFVYQAAVNRCHLFAEPGKEESESQSTTRAKLNSYVFDDTAGTGLILSFWFIV
jgi:hypothetical protein